MKKSSLVSKVTLPTILIVFVVLVLMTFACKVDTKENIKMNNTVVTEVMHYSDKARSGIALGGIGAGFAELRKDGIFYNWNIFNNQPKGAGPKINLPENTMLFFIVRYEEKGKDPQLKLLQIDDGYNVAVIRNQLYEFPWLSGMETIEYSARFPFINMKFTDSDMPFDIELEAYSPFIPNDVKNSSLPAMHLNFKITSKTNNPVDVMLMATLRNAVGYDVNDKLYSTELQDSDYKICEMSCTGMDTKESSFGTMALASLSPETSHYLGWNWRYPYYEYVLQNGTLPNIDDTKERNIIEIDKTTGKKRPLKPLFSTLAVSGNLENAEVLENSFIVSWDFPNAYDLKLKKIVGNYYSNFFNSATEVADYFIENREDLYNQSKNFLNNFYESSIEPFILNQINSQLNTFITSSYFDKQGRFGIQEGLTSDRKWAGLATNDVGMQGSVPIIALFPELHKSGMRVIKAMQHESGETAHVFYPGSVNNDEFWAVNGLNKRIDVNSDYVILAMRDFFWTNDKAFLEEMWPSIKKTLDYVLEKRDSDGDLQPDVNLRNSYDNVPIYGFSAYVNTKWMSAITSAIAGAKILGDSAAEKKYKEVLEKGKELFDEKLWTGEYYRLYNNEDGKEHPGMNEGCLTDQIVGQWTNQLSGLDDIYPEARVKQVLQTIMNLSYKPGFGLRNGSWPGDDFYHVVVRDPALPGYMYECDQLNIFWSGTELAFASFLIYEDMYDQALDVIKTVDDRYRNAGRYWDHQEWGGHYYRAMSAWSVINALLGLTINQEVYSFSPKVPQDNFKLFFAFPGGTAFFTRSVNGTDRSVTIEVLSGQFMCKQLNYSGPGIEEEDVNVLIDNEPVQDVNKKTDVSGLNLSIDFNKTTIIDTGQTLQINF